MFAPQKLEKQSDSLIDLLTAQCRDLEKLLSLAREETVAATLGDFDGILRIVSERAHLSDKLETFQRQIADLRQRLGSEGEPIWQSSVAVRMSEVVRQIVSHDAQTQFLLTTARQKSADELKNLEYSQRGSNAYLRETHKGLAYSQSF